jgi:HPt (histidine-containing phosphotransfer) domain-containing protein
VPDFFVDSGEHLKQLEQGFNNKNSEAVRKAAHALKGAAETVSAVKVYKIAKYMEDSAKQDKLEDAHQQLQTMRTAYKEFENFVTCQDWQQQARRSVSISTR